MTEAERNELEALREQTNQIWRAIRDVEEALTAAHRLFTDTTAPDKHARDRQATADALTAVMLFLTDGLGLPKDLVHPLRHVLGAIGDADEGRRNDFWQGPPKTPGAPLSRDIELALAAVAVTLLKEAGRSIKQAAHEVVKAIPGKNVSAKGLLAFRKEVMGHRKAVGVNMFYESRLKEARDSVASDPNLLTDADRSNAAAALALCAVSEIVRDTTQITPRAHGE